MRLNNRSLSINSSSKFINFLLILPEKIELKDLIKYSWIDCLSDNVLYFKALLNVFPPISDIEWNPPFTIWLSWFTSITLAAGRLSTTVDIPHNDVDVSIIVIIDTFILPFFREQTTAREVSKCIESSTEQWVLPQLIFSTIRLWNPILKASNTHHMTWECAVFNINRQAAQMPKSGEADAVRWLSVVTTIW